MKILTFLLIIVPSLSLSLTFKDGKQVDEKQTISETQTIDINDIAIQRECPINDDFPISDLISDKFQFTRSDFKKVLLSIPLYRRNTEGSLDPLVGDTVEPRIMLVEDFNNDNIDDLLIEYHATWVAPVIAYGQKNGKFKLLKLQDIDPNAARKSIRKAVAVDFNKDGFMDIYGFTTGDHYKEMKISERDVLLINDSGNGFKSIDIPESRKNAGNHGGFVIDIDNDGWVDIVPLDEKDGYGSFPIKNINGKKFELQKKHISSDIKKYWIEDGEAADLNNDGFYDMVVSVEENSEVYPTNRNRIGTFRIIYGDGDFNFNDNIEVKIGSSWINKENFNEIKNVFGNNLNSGTANINLLDINNDNKIDILISEFIKNQNFNWRTSGFKAYINKGDCFADETNLYFPNQITNRKVVDEAFTQFIGRFLHVDINQDGFKDLILRNWWDEYGYFRNSTTNSFPYIFMNHNNKTYYPLSFTSGEVFRKLHSLSPGDFNGDGIIDIVGIDHSSGGAELATFYFKSLEEASNLISFPIEEGHYKLSWYVQWQGEGYLELLGQDEVLIEGSSINLIKLDNSFTEISPSNRKNIEFIKNNKKIQITGNLDLFSDGETDFVSLEGINNILDKSDFSIGYYELKGFWDKDLITVQLIPIK